MFQNFKTEDKKFKDWCERIEVIKHHFNLTILIEIGSENDTNNVE